MHSSNDNFIRSPVGHGRDYTIEYRAFRAKSTGPARAELRAGFNARLACGVLVVLLHAALIAYVLLRRAAHGPQLFDAPLQLVMIERVPPARPDSFMRRPRRPVFTAVTLIAIPPTVTLAAAPTSAPASVPAGPGSGGSDAIDWAAESRRALRAYEIRRDIAAAGAPIDGAAVWENWTPQREHRAGDHLRNDRGDWIVWTSARCYQIADAAVIRTGPATADAAPAASADPLRANICGETESTTGADAHPAADSSSPADIPRAADAAPALE